MKDVISPAYASTDTSQNHTPSAAEAPERSCRTAAHAAMSGRPREQVKIVNNMAPATNQPPLRSESRSILLRSPVAQDEKEGCQIKEIGIRTGREKERRSQVS